MKLEITIAELAALVGGELQLASMPPLGGTHEPAGRIVSRLSEVQAGDVYAAADDVDYAVEEAYARGACGVIVERSPLAPWAGRFAVLVSDVETAWQKLVVAARTRRPAPACCTSSLPRRMSA